jgi:hypothetical protein
LLALKQAKQKAAQISKLISMSSKVKEADACNECLIPHQITVALACFPATSKLV